MLRLKERIGRKFDEEIRFFQGWRSNMRAVGAIVPTSAVTARRMASVANPRSGLPVLELGPGTGVITKAILERGVTPEKLISVEYSTFPASTSSTATPSTWTRASARWPA